MSQQTAITPTRTQDFPEWYQQVIKGADMAENSEVRGCMVIKPWGYAIWELIQKDLDQRFKDTGHTNAYFPLLIPISYLEKEADHAEGFATECAVVTHHRLEAQKDETTGKTRMIPTGELTEPFVIRPTSETVIGAAFARWTSSYRDLPLKINQWCNVMRWEMRPRIFLRTAEFLWQEGHTAHETREEAIEETLTMHKVYEEFQRDVLAIPTIPGEKRKRNASPERNGPTPWKPWCRTARPSRRAPPTSWARTSPNRRTSALPDGTTPSNSRGQVPGASPPA